MLRRGFSDEFALSSIFGFDSFVLEFVSVVIGSVSDVTFGSIDQS